MDLPPKMLAEEYLEKVHHVMDYFARGSDDQIKGSVETIKQAIPEGFKFSEAVLKNLFELEAELLDCHILKRLENFYELVFFAYEHADDQVQACQMYADLGNYSDEQQEIRTNAIIEKSYAEWSGRIIYGIMTQNAPSVKLLYHWLYVMDPKSKFFSNTTYFAPLPKLSEPRKHVRKTRTLNIPKNRRDNFHKKGGVKNELHTSSFVRKPHSVVENVKKGVERPTSVAGFEGTSIVKPSVVKKSARGGLRQLSNVGARLVERPERKSRLSEGVATCSAKRKDLPKATNPSSKNVDSDDDD